MTGAPKRLVVPAPAKLNLFLHVTGRRDDGYHTLESLFVALDFGDTIAVEAREDGAIVRLRGARGVAPEDDLAVRAACALKDETGVAHGAGIAIDKRIPMGSGLGGGSSDAASVLLALNRLWGLALPRATLASIAVRLGADVPFFVSGEAAFARGVGDELVPVSVPPTWFALVFPPVEVSTALVFAARELTRDAPSTKMLVFPEGFGRNDLERVAAARFPGIAEHLRMLGCFGNARMTGSGACVFAAFESEESAHHALRSVPHGTAGCVARSLNAHPLRDFARAS